MVDLWIVARARPMAVAAALLALTVGLVAAIGVAHARGRETVPSPRGPAVQNGIVWWVPTTSNAVALTFDDGPDPKFTPKVLQQLRQHRAVGTFFVLGAQAARFPGIVRQEAAEGSEVCGHGWTHMRLRGKSPSAVRKSVTRTADLLSRLGLPRCPLFRFPYFASDPTARAAVAGLGYRMVGADIDTQDYLLPTVPRMVARVLGPLRPGDIVLFHDGGGDRRRSVQALGLVLDGLAARGLRPVTVTALLASVPHGASGVPNGE